MHFLLFTTLLTTLGGLGMAQVGQIPTCALNCFASAISKSGCALDDYVCQCTSPGHQKITKDVTSCLCQGGCSQNDLSHAQTAANRVCTSALAAHGQTYSTTMYGLTACGMATADVTPNAAAPTNGPMSLGYEKAMLGLAGLAAFVV